MKTRERGLREAIRAAGNLSELARRLGLTPQAVQQWRRVPPKHIVAIEYATGVKREMLRPDLYRHY